MDSFELNKVAGAVLGVLTLTLGLNVFADILFSSHAPEKPGFEIAVQEGSAGEAQAAAPADVPIAQLLAAASPEKGAAQARSAPPAIISWKAPAPRSGRIFTPSSVARSPASRASPIRRR
ncbi:hypothetical protein ACFSKM_20435 [Ancylobacter dichloromethanicus]